LLKRLRVVEQRYRGINGFIIQKIQRVFEPGQPVVDQGPVRKNLVVATGFNGDTLPCGGVESTGDVAHINNFVGQKGIQTPSGAKDVLNGEFRALCNAVPRVIAFERVVTLVTGCDGRLVSLVQHIYQFSDITFYFCHPISDRPCAVFKHKQILKVQVTHSYVPVVQVHQDRSADIVPSPIKSIAL